MRSENPICRAGSGEPLVSTVSCSGTRVAESTATRTSRSTVWSVGAGEYELVDGPPGDRAGPVEADGVPTCRRKDVVAAAHALERWGNERGWRGPDPYDGLNATRLAPVLRRSPLALRILTQIVKRSPVNLRPVLRVPEGVSPATLALVISAYPKWILKG